MASRILRLRHRLARGESGFTLIELLVVLVIIGILLAIAVPSYLGFKARASRGAAEANVRSAVPAVEAYYSTHGGYAGMTGAELKLIDAGTDVTVVSADLSTYCITGTNGDYTYYKNGPAGAITTVPCT
jgi:type IV pilus assembly protein PilA